MKSPTTTILRALAAVGVLLLQAIPLEAQAVERNTATAPKTFWELVHEQDKHFNKAGSMLPQRYTQPRAAAPMAHAPSYVAQNRPMAAPAAQPVEDASQDYISELRLSILSHDIRFPSRHKFHVPNPFENRYESGLNLSPEVVFASPDWLEWLWEPRPHVGASFSTSGDTSSIYTGLGWDTDWDNGVFLDGFFGLAAHNGELHDGNPKGKIEFGSRVLFRLGGEVGWRWDGHNAVGLVWEHMSNGSILASKNQGIDSLGLRYSYRFDTPK